MKILKAVLLNPLVLATLVTVLASTVLVAYSEHRFQSGAQVGRSTPRAADGLPRNLIASSVPGLPDAVPGKGAETPAAIVWGIEIPAGSYIDSML